MSNSIEHGYCFYERPDVKCPFGKPICTPLCDYKPYASRFLKMKIEWKYVVRFFKMYRKWQAIYWEKYILPK